MRSPIPTARLLYASTILLVAFLSATGAGADIARVHELEARVDPRVELLSIVFRLTGANEYNQAQSNSPYGKAVDAHFGPFREHKAIKVAVRLRESYGIGFDAPMALALHLEDTVGFKERIPFDEHPARLDDRWTVKEARRFVRRLKSFARDTKFNEFMKEHADLFDTAAARMTEHLETRAYVEWFDAYFGAKPGAQYAVIVGMLNGPANYGSGIRFPDGREEITPIIGASRFDDDGIPVFGDSVTGTIVHEFCHSYTNPIVDMHRYDLEDPGRRMHALCGEKMGSQGYGTWDTMMYESFVRSVVVRYMRERKGESAASTQIGRERARAFEWIGELSDQLGKYEADRTRYPTFDDFAPRIVGFFEGYVGGYERQKAREAQAAASAPPAPRIVSMTPPNGAKDVDPGLTEIKVVFDQPMKNGSWAVVGGGPAYPETGRVFYDKACKVLTIPVQLKPDWSYEFWLNHPPYDAFESAKGVKLDSVHVTFETGGER